MKYQLGEKVITPHGEGTIVDIEASDAGFNSVHYNDERAITWRYGVNHFIQPTGFRYTPMYYFSRELRKGDLK
jgi:hypothetical protein